MPNPICVMPACEKPARSRTADWCPMHYHRWYRHGSPDTTAAALLTSTRCRTYKARRNPAHPLADVQGNVWEHRMVLFDAIGYGPHPCHWCGAHLDWLPKGTAGELHVDHLNTRGDDNRLANLVPACPTCNVTRGAQARSEALRSVGLWSSHDTVAALRDGRRKRIAEPS